MTDDYAIPHRDELEAAVDAVTPQEGPAPGPFARPAVSLLAANRAPIRQLLARYDELAARGPLRASTSSAHPRRADEASWELLRSLVGRSGGG